MTPKNNLENPADHEVNCKCCDAVYDGRWYTECPDCYFVEGDDPELHENPYTKGFDLFTTLGNALKPE